MKNSSILRRVAYVLLFGFALLLMLVAWGTYRVGKFVGELPGRIVIDVDDELIQAVFVESTKMGLREGPKEQRLEIIEYLADAGPDARGFLDVLAVLAEEEADQEIAEAARGAIAAINEPDEN